MLLLVGVAFVAGVVTAISPCVLPVLPIVLAGGATGGRRRPYAIVAGLVVSFTAFTLAATALLSALGLPDDLLRNIAIGVVLLVGISLLVPALGRLVERPFQGLGRRRPGDAGGGFLLGTSLGLLFTPCAGPVIAAVAALAATSRFSVESVLVTLSYALGAGVVVAVALDPRRLQLVTAILLVGPWAALGVWAGSRSAALTRIDSSLSEAAEDGRRLAIVLALQAAAGAVAERKCSGCSTGCAGRRRGSSRGRSPS